MRSHREEGEARSPVPGFPALIVGREAPAAAKVFRVAGRPDRVAAHRAPPYVESFTMHRSNGGADVTFTEWEEAKAHAAGDTRMRLNGYPAADHPGCGTGSALDLVVEDDELGKLGNLAYGLRQQLGSDGGHAAAASGEAATSLTGEGLDMGAALGDLNEAWETKLKTLKDACGQLSDHLDYTRAAHHKDEDKITGAMSSIATLDDRIK